MDRLWAMPSKNTFSIKPIRMLVDTVFADQGLMVRCCAIDPFVGNSPFKQRCLSNDIDPDIAADKHMDAYDFLVGIDAGVADIVLYDPPYSPRQVSEVYRRMSRTVNMETTQATFWTKLKGEIARITKPGATVVSCGWNSGGIGKVLGFEIERILLVAHGGPHNDTIVTVERKRHDPNQE